jgi:hypothetical protein
MNQDTNYILANYTIQSIWNIKDLYNHPRWPKDQDDNEPYHLDELDYYEITNNQLLIQWTDDQDMEHEETFSPNHKDAANQQPDLEDADTTLWTEDWREIITQWS